ncbi:DUF1648 domain-containing protein [Pseudonocardia alaniniphila]|uniref:DUF1648 domain-containing protein n=1 Tax=Pseudonocardia alaniniphila TaxID=75291 RepID=A0ABS9TR90_9PSEU|nr:DUF1648 domain-containing protein [Pseudonocardia alaniniphila]MCH6171063.1 DUF1648 domain-containing protein [Pseudonocardia alaniniphila]
MATIRTRRALLAGIPPLIALAPVITLLATAVGGLPDPMASHFGWSGSADGYAGRSAIIVMAAVLAVGLALLFGLVAHQGGTRNVPGSRWDTARWLVGVSWATAGLVGVVLFGSVVANLGLTDPAEAVLPWWTFPLGLLTAVVAGAVGGLVAPRTPGSGEEAQAVTPMTIGPTEQISWSRTVGSPWFPLVGAALVVAGGALGIAVNPVAGIGALVAGVAVTLLARARVTVDRRGLTVALGLIGWPRLRVPADDVASVTVADISPAQFGGWGYRVVPGGRGVIIRSGPALVVTRRSGRQVTVTVDDPETAAGVLAGVANAKGGPC